MSVPLYILQSLFDYNISTGELLWKYRPDKDVRHNNRWANRPALSCIERATGARMGRFEGTKLYKHRVCYALGTETEMRNDIYHRNRNKDDNSILNLGSFHYRETAGYPPHYADWLQSHGILPPH